jgi:hypothetical protein
LLGGDARVHVAAVRRSRGRRSRGGARRRSPPWLFLRASVAGLALEILLGHLQRADPFSIPNLSEPVRLGQPADTKIVSAR